MNSPNVLKPKEVVTAPKAGVIETITFFPRWLTVTTGIAVHILVAWHIATVIYNGLNPWLWIIMIIAAWWFLDLITLFTHWLLDNYFDPTTPVIGKTVYYFREHHRTPEAMFVRDYFDNNFENALFAASILLICVFLPLHPAVVLFLAVAGLGGSYITTVHKWSHEPKPPGVVKVLQKLKLLVDAGHHDRHHADTRGHYALFAGHTEFVIEGIRFFEWSERWVYLFTGSVAVETRLKLGVRGESTTFRQRWRRLFWRGWYGFLVWYSRRQNLQFNCMNWGYADLNGTETGGLQSEPERYQLQLYAAVAKGISVEGGLLADISCGRGGGIHWLHSQLKPLRSVGVDFTPSNIQLCNKNFSGTAGLSFLHGDAENMPFENNSVRLLLSVEASHCYPRPAQFLAEAERVLEPGGWLAWTDFRPANEMEQLRSLIPAGLELVHDLDITHNVLLGMEKDSPRRMQMIKQHVTPILRPIMRHFAAADDSAETVKRFKNGSSVYFLWQLRKR